jgi:acetyl-CoA synthetase
MKVRATGDRIAELLAEYGAARLSVAEALCDRHPPGDVAFTLVEADASSRDLTYGELAERSRSLASSLAGLGIGRGDRVATLMAKSAELVVAMLAIWRCGAVYVPLFTAFAEPAVAMRLDASDAKLVFVDSAQRPKIAPSGRTIVTTGGAGLAGDLAFEDLLAEPLRQAQGDKSRGDKPQGHQSQGHQSQGHQPQHVTLSLSKGGRDGTFDARLGGDAPFVRLFTSGTTGEPKGVVIPARALAAFVAYAEFGLDLRADDVYWNAADPGWAYGLYYAICAPLALGRRSLLLRAPFSPQLTYDVLTRFGVTNFAAAPTVYRALRAADRQRSPALRLRRCSSAGEPLGPDIVTWAETALGVPVHDQYGQTELGMAVVNGHHPAVAAPLRPGSMGRAMPGWRVAVLREGSATLAEPGELGRVAVDLAQSPLMWFDAYADAPERTAERFLGERFYLTGDAGTMDADGYVFFSARDDDVIIMAGYRIGPFEIESVLHEHRAVAESAVVGVPDELRGEVVEAFVVLRSGEEASPELAYELQQHVKQRYAAHAYPRLVHFVRELPKTPSGKIQRFLLREERRRQFGAKA